MVLKKSALLFIIILLPQLSISAQTKNDFNPPAYYGAFKSISLNQITPQGWLKELLVRQRDGLGLHHAESGYPYNTCLWAGQIPKGGNPRGQAWWPYEQTGYLVDGLYRCGLALNDTALKNLGKNNISYVLSHPRENGMLGPDNIGTTQWPFTVFVRSMMADYDATSNPEILKALTRHFLALSTNHSEWGGREVCIIESICWTYEHTGDERLVAFAESIWDSFTNNNKKNKGIFQADKMAAADSAYGHGVTANEVGKQPAILYLCTGKEKYKDEAAGFFSSLYRDHVLADGIPSSSESLSGKHQEGLHETCDISDYTWSLGYLVLTTGEVKWADRIERGIFNAGLGAISKDFKSHQYFSSPNQIFATQTSSTAKFNGEGKLRQAYRPGFETECCSGNVHRMFPDFVANMWLSDKNNGVVASLYAPCILKTKVSSKQKQIEITEETGYPFFGDINFKMKMKSSTKFDFSMRIPEWAKGAAVQLNNEKSMNAEAGKYFKLSHNFKNGDIVKLHLPMQIIKEEPVKNGVSIARGPLLFSLAIAEDAKPVTNQNKTSQSFPAWDVMPASPWNYSLAIDDDSGFKNISVVANKINGFPWDIQNSPVTLVVPARRIPAWDATGTMPVFPANFKTSDLEKIKLIPDGATRIRLSIFPVNK